ncbi:unnamed protein product [Rhizophagus irregularis]|nr:unnamed protein product [Rhizophagus irregularis]
MENSNSSCPSGPAQLGKEWNHDVVVRKGGHHMTSRVLGQYQEISVVVKTSMKKQVEHQSIQTLISLKLLFYSDDFRIIGIENS